MRYLAGLCLAPGLPWLGLRPAQRGLDFSVAVTYSVCSVLRNEPKAQFKGQLQRRARTNLHQQHSQRSSVLSSSAPAVTAVTRTTLHRRCVPCQSSQHLSPRSPAARLLALRSVTGTMEHTDSFHSNSSLHSPTGEGRARPLPGALQMRQV